METVRVLYRGKPLDVNKKIMEALSWNTKATHLELLIYFYCLSYGEVQTVFNEEFVVVDLDLKNLMEYFGYSQSRVYRAIQRLVEFGIIKKMSVSSRTGEQTLLLITEEVNFEKIKAKFPSRMVLLEENDSTGEEQFYSKNVSDETSQVVANNDFNVNKDAGGKDMIGSNDGHILRSNIYNLNTRNILSTRNSILSTRNILSTRSKKNNTDEESSQGGQENLFGEQEIPKKSSDGYYAKEYVYGGKRFNHKPKSAKAKIIHIYMNRVFVLHGIDYYIPKSKLVKYYKGAERMLKLLGSMYEVETYIDWFLRKDQFKASGYNLDMLISSSVINQYNGAPAQDTRRGLARGYIREEEREEYLRTHKGVRI